MAEECPIDCQIKSQIECPIEFPIKCQLCQIECPIECPIKCQHICHNMECQKRMPGWMFYFGKMLGNVCQMECRNVCQITCHKKRFVRSYDVRKYAMVGLFFGRKSFGVSWPHPPHLTEATAGSASTAHPADAAHAPRCTSRSGALSWNLRSNGSWAPQTPGRQLKVRKAWGTNRISIPFVIGHNSQHGVQLARTFLMSSNHYIYYNNIYIYV